MPHCCLAPCPDLSAVTQKVRTNKRCDKPNKVGLVDERGKLMNIFAQAKCAGGLQSFCIRKRVVFVPDALNLAAEDVSADIAYAFEFFQ